MGQTGARRRWTLEEKQRIVAESFSAPRNASATGSVQNLSHIYSGDSFGLHDLRLIERSHVHVALGGPCRTGDVAQPRGRQVEA